MDTLKMKMTKFLVIFISLVFFTGQHIYGQKHDLTTFILVRHAEKSNNHPQDPDLNNAGLLRAQGFAEKLAYAHIDVALSTPFKRNRQTLDPVAKQKNLQIIEYDPADKNLIKRTYKAHKGRSILIAGHSNTIPGYVNQLASTSLQQLDESEYDKIFIVTLKKMGKGKVLILKD